MKYVYLLQQNGDGVDGDGGGGGDISTDYETEQNEYLTFSAVVSIALIFLLLSDFFQPYLHNGFRAMSMDDKDGEEKAVEPPNNYPLTTSVCRKSFLHIILSFFSAGCDQSVTARLPADQSDPSSRQHTLLQQCKLSLSLSLFFHFFTFLAVRPGSALSFPRVSARSPDSKCKQAAYVDYVNMFPSF